ncbi:uncharacterized protein RHOBADRAFT_66686 [Rhodotorula graminis WP1]|uniref:Phosphoglycerate mutase-like protein n=1 Tax=Rhodotorula graminis (strain WP1) TaxID=578459 RepID=A0A0P9GKN8_RHOGW|nr:uncharacterized protein RHOBADRAFT_66686 [Rhodotorula graminis WP1]KPV73943.1 hypothetical protein RHOBADRAFT_66686 [Rhodotorula graminis WP1]
MNSNAPLGAVILARHGDRSGFYQDPKTYTASSTVLTSLGEQQNYQLGQLMASVYAGANESTAIAKLSKDVFVDSQVNSTADAGGEGSVISDSALAFWQGFYPPRTNASTTTLANGSVVSSPLGGYQYVKVVTVLPEDDIDFEPWTNCAAWTNRTSELYASPAYTERAEQDQDLLDLISSSGLVGERTVSMANFYNVWDYMNVNSIHNASFVAKLNETGGENTLARARDLANFHEYNLFTDSTPGGLGNLPGRTVFSRILESLNAFTAEDNDVVLSHYHFAYKPFLSIFNMTNLAAAPGIEYPNAMVDYASAAVFELRDGGSGPSGFDVRFGFRNGSDTSDALAYYPLFGTDSVDMDLDTFQGNLQPHVIPNNTVWCNLCNNNGSVAACSEIALAQSYEDLAAKYKDIADGHFTSVGSGFIGACVTIVVGLAVLGLLRALGWVQFGKRRAGEEDRYPLHSAQSFKGSVASRG